MPYQVEIAPIEENALSERMETIRTWLDERRFEPASFRYTFTRTGIVFRVDFTVGAEAEAFAAEFGGKLLNGIRMAV